MSTSVPEVESDNLHLHQLQAAAAIKIRPWVKAHTAIIKHAFKWFGVTEREDRDDLAQNVFLSAYRALVRGEQIDNPRAWLCEHARRHASNYRHKASRRSQYIIGDLLVYGKDSEQTTSDRETLKKALAALTEDARDLLLDIRFEGVSWDEAAKERGITVEQARWICRVAISRLEKALKALHGSEKTIVKSGKRGR